MTKMSSSEWKLSDCWTKRMKTDKQIKLDEVKEVKKAAKRLTVKSGVRKITLLF